MTIHHAILLAVTVGSAGISARAAAAPTPPPVAGSPCSVDPLQCEIDAFIGLSTPGAAPSPSPAGPSPLDAMQRTVPATVPTVPVVGGLGFVGAAGWLARRRSIPSRTRPKDAYRVRRL